MKCQFTVSVGLIVFDIMKFSKACYHVFHVIARLMIMLYSWFVSTGYNKLIDIKNLNIILENNQALL